MIGAVMLVAGAAGLAWSVPASTNRKRPLDLVAALLAPIAFLVALGGGVALVVPHFLG